MKGFPHLMKYHWDLEVRKRRDFSDWCFDYVGFSLSLECLIKTSSFVNVKKKEVKKAKITYEKSETEVMKAKRLSKKEVRVSIDLAKVFREVIEYLFYRANMPSLFCRNCSSLLIKIDIYKNNKCVTFDYMWITAKFWIDERDRLMVFLLPNTFKMSAYA